MSDWSRFKQVDIGLLIEIYQDDSSKESDKDDSFLAICFRLREDLISKCEKYCKRRGYDNEVANEIARKCLERFGRFKSFNAKKCKVEDILICFKLYLYRIAKNALNDYYKLEAKRAKGLLYRGDESIVKSLPNINIDSMDTAAQIIHRTIMKLPHSHQVIYYTYKSYEKEGVKLPRKLLAELREYLGISQTTIRTYKKEVIDKIEEARIIISQIQGDK